MPSSSQDGPQPPSQLADPEALFEALLQSAGSHPATDAVYAQLADAFLASMDQGRGPRRWSLRAGFEAQGPLQNIARRLAGYGVRRVEISPTATALDLHQLAAALTDHVGPGPPILSLSSVHIALWNEPEVEEPEEADDDGVDDTAPEHIRRSLDEVLNVGAEALAQSLEDVNPDALKIEDLKRVFEAAESAIQAPTKADWSVVEDMPDPLGPVASAPAPPEPQPVFSISELQGMLDELAFEARGPLDLRASDGGDEEIAILLELFLAEVAQTPPTSLPPRLKYRLRKGLSDPAQIVWWNALKQLMGLKSPVFFDRVFPLVVRAIRYSGPLSLTDEISVLARGACERGLETLWPHAANELLLTQRERGHRTPPELVALVASLPRHAIDRAIPRLVELGALGDGLLAKDAFNARQLALYPMFERLLESSCELRIGRCIVRGLRAAPPNCEVSVVLPAMRDFTPGCTPFLARLLTEDWSQGCSPGLCETGLELLTELLGGLSAEFGAEPWLLHAIAWIGHWRYAGARPFLQRVRTERRAPFVNAWPAECRAAAKQALRSIAKGSS